MFLIQQTGWDSPAHETLKKKEVSYYISDTYFMTAHKYHIPIYPENLQPCYIISHVTYWYILFFTFNTILLAGFTALIFLTIIY